MKPADKFQDRLMACRHCQRLTHQFRKLTVSHPEYWNKPVPPSGPEQASLLLVGLAPGMHGANRSGIPFTGDASGDLLYRVLADTNLADRIRITNAVKCLPIQNLPSGKETRNCSKFLVEELKVHAQNDNPVVIALGGVAHRAIISTLGLRQKDYPFAHAAIHLAGDLSIVDSYHCSRYNTQTGRLTYEMFLDVIRSAGNMAYP